MRRQVEWCSGCSAYRSIGDRRNLGRHKPHVDELKTQVSYFLTQLRMVGMENNAGISVYSNECLSNARR
jgi:hypothetical protein